MTDSGSMFGLDRLIPGEIKDDEFYYVIQAIAARSEVKTVLEIGSSSGEGSTEAFVTGLRQNPGQPTLFCMEVSRTRFRELSQRYQGDPFVKSYNVSSVALDDFVTEEHVIQFYQTTPSNLNVYPLAEVLRWWRKEIEYVTQADVPGDGIRQIKQEHQIEYFDMVLLNGSQFTGEAELAEVYGARYILLDDIQTLKNYANHQRLLNDANYELIHQNLNLRHGYSVFQRRNPDAALVTEPVNQPSSTNLPIHFFTIVLNGEPFIRYHIEVFNQLPFSWHWHIVEGVAAHNHDSAWVRRFGGQITEAIHRNGVSMDGTTEYLDDLKRQYPDQVHLYRPPAGRFWDGKREMVNAPLPSIQEDCLLWQVDVDEFWTVEQLCTARQLFLEHPQRTAAWYWCWFFVAADLVVTTRNCYSQNPQQEWLRTWRYKPGYVWASHSPPQLVKPLLKGTGLDMGKVNPFSHAETEAKGLVFQHFSYVTPAQLQFKETYYGYANAIAQWQELQHQSHFPTRLRQYFAWVDDLTLVDRAAVMGVVPLAQRSPQGDWVFHYEPNLQQTVDPPAPVTPLIALDGVFFQRYKTGVARVWTALLTEWVKNGFAQHLLVLDRMGTMPDIPGIQYRPIEGYNPTNPEADRQLLQQTCDHLGVDLFISTYYTTPISTPSVVLIYDMIVEVMGDAWQNSTLKDKQRAIAQATDYLAISQNTARDVERLLPEAVQHPVTVAYCGVSDDFKPASADAITQFRYQYGIQKPYFMVMSADNPSPYKNNQLFFQAFAQLASKTGFELVCTAFEAALPAEWRACTQGVTVHLLRLSDAELAIAYSGAIALIYPSRYEGFGMPILEAMACGCPVITCANSSIPEVGGTAVLYVDDTDPQELADALGEVQKPSVRQRLIAAGLEQASQFSWTQMAAIVQERLLAATLACLNLRRLNVLLVVDGQQSDEILYEQLAAAIATLLTHPDQAQITLLLDTCDLPEELDLNLLLGEVVMAVMLEYDLAIEEPGIAPLPALSSGQWEVLRSRLWGYLVVGKDGSDEQTSSRLQGVTQRSLADLQAVSLSGSMAQ